jgi:hypothetical protein
MSARLGAAASASLLLACAAREPPPPQAAVPALAIDARLTELRGVEQALGASLLSTPDCPRAHEHLRALCALADAICAETREGQAAPHDARCLDARTRCASAEQRVKERCP